MHAKHTEKSHKSLAQRIAMYIILVGVIILGIYLLKPSLPQKQSVQQPCQYDNAVCSYLSKLRDPSKHYGGPFTVSITTIGANQAQSRVVIKSDAQNNLDIITYDEHVLTGQRIVLGDTVYNRNLASNTWTKTNNTIDPALRNIKEKSLREVTKSGTDVSYKFIGDSKCGKKTCMKYELITKPQSPDKTYVLFTQTNHILKEIIKQSPDGSTSDILFVYTEVTITPPPTR